MLQKAEQEIRKLLTDMKSHVAYAKTGIAQLVEEWDILVKRYTSDIVDFKRQVNKLERRIDDLPRLIEEAEQVSDRMCTKAMQLEGLVTEMDKRTKQHESNAYATVAAADGSITLRALTSRSCIKI